MGWGQVEVRMGWGQAEVRMGWGQAEVRMGWDQVEVRMGWGQVEVRMGWGQAKVKMWSPLLHTYSPLPSLHLTTLFSSLCYNPYHKARLVSSDYDGAVCVWDTSTGTRLIKFQVQWGSFCGGRDDPVDLELVGAREEGVVSGV